MLNIDLFDFFVDNDDGKIDENLRLKKSIENSILDILQNRANLQDSELPFSFGIPDLTTKCLIDPCARKKIEKIVLERIKKYEKRIFAVNVEFVDTVIKNAPILSIRGKFNCADRVNDFNFNVEI